MVKLNETSNFFLVIEGDKKRTRLQLYSNGNGDFFLIFRILFYPSVSTIKYAISEKGFQNIKDADTAFNSYYEFFNGKDRKYDVEPFKTLDDCFKACGAL